MGAGAWVHGCALLRCVRKVDANPARAVGFFAQVRNSRPPRVDIYQHVRTRDGACSDVSALPLNLNRSERFMSSVVPSARLLRAGTLLGPFSTAARCTMVSASRNGTLYSGAIAFLSKAVCIQQMSLPPDACPASWCCTAYFAIHQRNQHRLSLTCHSAKNTSM